MSTTNAIESMNAAETIAAAIEKLETLRTKSTTGEWWEASWGRDIYAGPGLSDDVLVTENCRLPDDAELIVALHRTIDAQLASLRHALARAESKISTGGNMRSVWSHEVDAENLARAILGEVS